jgi:hypothetical protein
VVAAAVAVMQVTLMVAMVAMVAMLFLAQCRLAAVPAAQEETVSLSGTFLVVCMELLLAATQTSTAMMVA